MHHHYYEEQLWQEEAALRLPAVRRPGLEEASVGTLEVNTQLQLFSASLIWNSKKGRLYSLAEQTAMTCSLAAQRSASSSSPTRSSDVR